MSDAHQHPASLGIGHGASLSAGSSLSPEQERDYFKEKVEHFKHLTRNLQDEVQSYKLRKEGTATVSKLLQESKQEVVSLTKRIRAYDSIVRILQSRLEKHGLSTEITLQDDEQYLPSNSKKLIDNLTRENHRLRNVIKSNSGDPEEFARLQQALNEGKQTNNDLQTRIVELEEVLRASDNDKDRTITQLREELSHLNRELNARDFKCSSLAKETEKLQKQLEDVAYQCHDLAKKLQEQSITHSSKTSETNMKEEIPMDVNEDTAALAEENKALKIRVHEITEMNKRWQDYNKQRETCMTQLSREIDELKSSQTQRANNDVNRDFELQMNQVLDEARKTIEAETRKKNQVQVQLDSASRTIMALTEENRLLKQRPHAVEGSPDSEETIQALKAQIQICTEDFESERKDREKAQTKISRQESELMRLRKEVDDLRRQREHWLSSPPAPQTQYTDPFYHYQPVGSPGSISTERLAPRGVTRGRQIDQYNVFDSTKTQHDGVDTEKTDAIKDVIKSDDDAFPAEEEVAKNRSPEDEYHSLRTSSLSSNSNRASPSGSPRRSENTSPTCDMTVRDAQVNTQVNTQVNACLKCPKCAKEYSVDEHSELLEHIEICCE